MISPLPRTSQYRPDSTSFTCRTLDCSMPYCSFVMGTITRLFRSWLFPSCEDCEATFAKLAFRLSCSWTSRMWLEELAFSTGASSTCSKSFRLFFFRFFLACLSFCFRFLLSKLLLSSDEPSLLLLLDDYERCHRFLVLREFLSSIGDPCLLLCFITFLLLEEFDSLVGSPWWCCCMRVPSSVLALDDMWNSFWQLDRWWYNYCTWTCTCITHQQKSMKELYI